MLCTYTVVAVADSLAVAVALCLDICDTTLALEFVACID